MAILVQMEDSTRFSLLDPAYCVFGGASTPVTKDHLSYREAEYRERCKHYRRDEFSGLDDLFVDAQKWADDLIGELNACARGRYYPVDGAYGYTKRKSKDIAEDAGGNKVKGIAYAVNDVELAWIVREGYTSRRSAEIGNVSRYDWKYHELSRAYRVSMKTHSHLALAKRKLLSDIGAPVKRVAKALHKDTVYMNASQFVESSIDKIVADEHAASIIKAFELNGFEVTSTSNDIGSFEMDAKIAHHGLSRVHINDNILTHDVTFHGVGGPPVGATTSKVSVYIEMLGKTEHLRSFMQQLCVALPIRHFDAISSIDVRVGNKSYSNSMRIPFGDGEDVTITLLITPKTAHDAIEITEAIRRTDTWRAAWAHILSMRMREKN